MKLKRYLIYLSVITRVIGELDGDGFGGSLGHGSVQLLARNSVSGIEEKAGRHDFLHMIGNSVTGIE